MRGAQVRRDRRCTSPITSASSASRTSRSLGGLLVQAWNPERDTSRIRHSRLTPYERDPAVTEGFIWAAHTRLLLRRLTT